jgi:hypothetical protein
VTLSIGGSTVLINNIHTYFIISTVTANDPRSTVISATTRTTVGCHVARGLQLCILLTTSLYSGF